MKDAIIKVGGIPMQLNKSGHWTYNPNAISKSMAASMGKLRVAAPKYRDIPELQALSDLEFSFKQDFRKLIRITTLETVKFLDNISSNEK